MKGAWGLGLLETHREKLAGSESRLRAEKAWTIEAMGWGVVGTALISAPKLPLIFNVLTPSRLDFSFHLLPVVFHRLKS